MIEEYFFLTIRNLKKRKLRSYLTMLGIIIGITAIISLITLGNSFEKGITKRFDKFGTRRLFIGPKNTMAIGGSPSGASTLTEKDIETLEGISFIEYVTPILGESAEIKYGRETIYRDVVGFETENIKKAFADLDIKLLEGRWPEEQDAYVAIIGYRVSKDLFGKEVHEKNSLTINNRKFRVIGVLEEQGDREDDYAIRIPLKTAREIFNIEEEVSAITATVKPGMDLDEAEEKVKDALEKKRDDENFQVTNPKKLQKQTGQIIGIVKWVVVAIALIALIIGGIGIMNSMYTSVLERTREIGVMKAIGAKNSSVLSIFLFESGFLGFIGGIIGIAIGLGISVFAIEVINKLGFFTLDFELSFNLVIFGLLFSFILGIISGILPAIRAMRLRPVEALRYE